MSAIVVLADSAALYVHEHSNDNLGCVAYVQGRVEFDPLSAEVPVIASIPNDKLHLIQDVDLILTLSEYDISRPAMTPNGKPIVSVRTPWCIKGMDDFDSEVFNNFITSNISCYTRVAINQMIMNILQINLGILVPKLVFDYMETKYNSFDMTNKDVMEDISQHVHKFDLFIPDSEDEVRYSSKKFNTLRTAMGSVCPLNYLDMISYLSNKLDFIDQKKIKDRLSTYNADTAIKRLVFILLPNSLTMDENKFNTFNSVMNDIGLIVSTVNEISYRDMELKNTMEIDGLSEVIECRG